MTDFWLNGEKIVWEGDPAIRVIDLLREKLGRTGTKEGCGTGECGACAIHVNGELHLSCLMLAGQLQGCRVTTIEGMAPAGGIHPLQQAFLDSGAVQCGFCIPGMVMAGAALRAKVPDPSERQIREGLSGNLCRCTGYGKIIQAVRSLSLSGSAAEEGNP